jgi:hypothetical protein
LAKGKRSRSEKLERERENVRGASQKGERSCTEVKQEEI